MRHSKYNAQKVTIDGITFASQAEGKRYAELRILEKANVISGLKLQPEFKVVVNGVYICTYRADFSYNESGKSVVEDVKGMKTPVYRLKKKLVEALHGIKITEVTK